MDWVFPFTYGFMFPVDTPTYQPVKVDASQTPVGALVAPVTSKVARLVAYDTEMSFNPGVVSSLSSQVPAPGNISATLAAAATTAPIAAVANKTVTVYEVYLMLDAASATPAGGLLLQNSTPTTFGAMSVGVVNPPPWHGGVQGVKLPIGTGFQLQNNSGASITIRGCVINVQS